jgi:hypothetical protein
MSTWPQRRLTSADFLPKEADDCFLPADDPMWQHTNVEKIKTHEPTIVVNPDNSGSEKAQIMREQNIKPGTDAWFKLWFSKKPL